MTESITFTDRDDGITECLYVRNDGFEVLAGGHGHEDALAFARELAAIHDDIKARAAAGTLTAPTWPAEPVE